MAEDDSLDPSDFIAREQRRTMGTAMSSLGANPDDAARAQELSKATGDHPALIYSDLENYEQQNKAHLTAQLLNNNKYLRQYIDSHPLASKISNDDYGQLDFVSEKIGLLNVPGVGSVPTEANSAFTTAIKAFNENANPGTFAEEHRQLHSAIAGTSLPAQLAIAVNPLVTGAELFELGGRLTSGLIAGAAAGLTDVYKQLGGDEAWANRLTRDLIVLAQVGMSGQAGLHGIPAPHIMEMNEIAKAVKPFIDAGKEPPFWLHPVIDEIKVEQSKHDLKNLDDAFKEAQGSKTKERSPEIFGDFVRQHTEAKIGISADAVKELYKDKVPQVEDGILGDLIKPEELDAAYASGSDVHIPLADWLSKVDPEVVKELGDHIRVRPGGVTKAEAETAKAMVEAYHGSPHDFEAFSMEKIGTGEGAQSYGHGLYFAENKGVADTYATARRPGTARLQKIEDSILAEQGGDRQKAVKYLQDRISEIAGDDFRKDRVLEKLDLEEMVENLQQPCQSNKYRVRIHANKEDFLDHDTVLDKQAPGQKLLQAMDPTFKEHLETILEEYDQPELSELTGNEFRQLLERVASEEELPGVPTAEGKELNHREEASKFIAKQGIPGIKYLDQGSRPDGTRNLANAKRALDNEKKAFEDAKKVIGEGNVKSEVLETYKETLAHFQKIYDELANPTHNFVLFDDSLIEITHKNGEAVRTVRTAAGYDYIPVVDESLAEEARGAGISTFSKPTSGFTEHEKLLTERIQKIASRIAPSAETEVVQRVDLKGNEVRGAYLSGPDLGSIIAVSLNAKDVGRTTRHEAIHHLRDLGFFTKDEWASLEEAAKEGGWLGKHNIRERYKGQKNLKEEGLLEEAIAEEFAEWGSQTEAPREHLAKYSKEVTGAFEKLKEFFSQVLEAIKETFGHTPTIDELFEKVESGEVGKRKATEEGKAGAKTDEKQLELPQSGTTRLEDREAFEKAAAIGMTQAQYKRYMAKIAERQEEDRAYAEAQAKKEIDLRNSKEWKENLPSVRKEASEDIYSRPDVSADLLFSEGELYGEKVKRPKLRADALTPEQTARLPEAYIAKEGQSPDDIAGLFGYSTGDELVNRLGMLSEQRLPTGMSSRNFAERLVNIETERKMNERFGKSEENVLEEAKERALSETQLDLLHEETLALGLKAGAEFSITKNELKSWVKDQYSKMIIANVGSDKFIAAAGKAGRATEDFLLKDKALEAFRVHQQQYIATLMARESIGVEKAQDRFGKTAKRLSSREQPSILTEYTNWIHDILLRTGNQVKRSLQDLQEAIAHESHDNLISFIESKEAEERIVPVADFLLDPNYRKPVSAMTVEEFLGLKQSIDTLAKQGRDEKKIIRAGEEADRAEVVGEMKEQLQTFPLRTPSDSRGKVYKALDLPRTYIAAGTNTETLLNRWDRNNPRGVFNQTLIRPLSEAANYKARLDREYSKPYRDLGPIKDAEKLLPSPFPDVLRVTPEFPDGQPYIAFTRKNAMAILQNAGNANNWKVLTKGYGVEPEALWSWLIQNTTKEDWDRAQKLGDIFASANEKSDVVYRNVTGVAPEKIDIQPITTPFGEYKGWYHPLIYDPLREGRSKALMGGEVKDKPDSFRASTADSYTKRRTGYTAPLDLNFDMVPIRLSQILHNVAFREPIINASKVFYDPGFRREVTKHYGEIYRDGLVPYLKGVAGAESINSKAAAKGAQLSEFLRQNTISTYIGFNPYTALKHGPTALVLSSKEVGPVNFARAVSSLYGKSEEIGLSNSEFAMKHSEELQRRERHWQDTVVGQHKDIYDKPTLRESIIEKGSWLVAQSDMLSAKPTWLAQYNKSIGEGLDHGQSVFEADRAVRRAHGSTAVTNQPALVRGGGALHGWLTSVYGFFGTMMQRRIEIAHQINDTYKLGKEGELSKAASNVPALTNSIFTYVIWPTIVEEWVTGLTTDDKRGWGTHLFTAAMSGLGSSFIYVRDIMHAIATKHDPGVGLISSPLHDVSNLIRDLSQGKKMLDKQHAGKLVGDTLTVFGEVSGMAPKAISSAARFGIDLASGKAKPKTFTDWRMGLTRGDTKMRKEH